MKLLTFVLLFVFTMFGATLSFAEKLEKHLPYQAKAKNSLKTVVEEQIKQINHISNSTNSANENNIKGYVLSTHIRSFSDIPKNLDREIQKIRGQIKLLIRGVATDIEINGGTSGQLTLESDGRINYKPSKNLPKSLNEKREKLITANIKNSVSIRSAALAVNLLSGINEQLKQSAKEAKTRQQKEKIYMLQAIYVYEMADITLDLLNSLTLDGKQVIIDLHTDAKKRVKNRISDINLQVNKAKRLEVKGLLTNEQLEKETHTYKLMRKANEQSLDAWKGLISTVGKQQDFLNNLKNKKELIVYKRDKAKVQLETLRDLTQVAELRDTIGSLDDIVSSVASLDLLILDEETVQSLLGYSVGR